jgi:prepilin-type N-terminal cleavage/methylation domain-containing protein
MYTKSMRLKTAQGFTLIELLIVIAVLGILAVAVLSAINPIEQINRSRDTGSRSDAEQLLGAIDRYYATAGYYPWVTGAAITPYSTAWGTVDAAGWTDGATAVLTKLSEAGTGELKASFTNRITGTGYNTLYRYNHGSQGDSTYVCFLPKSDAFLSEAGVRCDGSLPSDFPADACAAGCAAAKTCYSCLP